MLSYDQLQRTLGRFIHGEEWEMREIPKAAAKTGAWLEDAAPFHESLIKLWMIDLADDYFEPDIRRARLVNCSKHQLRKAPVRLCL